MSKKPTVNELQFKFFSSADYRDACDRYSAAVDRARCTPKRGVTKVFAYFNDTEDTYKVTVIGGFGDVIERDLYSWDEVSTLLYENQ